MLTHCSSLHIVQLYTERQDALDEGLRFVLVAPRKPFKTSPMPHHIRALLQQLQVDGITVFISTQTTLHEFSHAEATIPPPQKTTQRSHTSRPVPTLPTGVGPHLEGLAEQHGVVRCTRPVHSNAAEGGKAGA